MKKEDKEIINYVLLTWLIILAVGGLIYVAFFQEEKEEILPFIVPDNCATNGTDLWCMEAILIVEPKEECWVNKSKDFDIILENRTMVSLWGRMGYLFIGLYGEIKNTDIRGGYGEFDCSYKKKDYVVLQTCRKEFTEKDISQLDVEINGEFIIYRGKYDFIRIWGKLYYQIEEECK